MLLTTAMILLTQSAYGVRVDGEGFLRFARGSQVVFSKQASLVVRSGLLQSEGGAALLPAVRIEAGAKFEIDLEGVVRSTKDGRILGRLVLAKFASRPEKAEGYFQTNLKASLGSPGEGLFGVIRTGSAPVANAAAIKGAEVEIAPRSEVEGEVVRLKDVATIRGEDALVRKLEAVELGRSPVFGTAKGLSPTFVTASIRMSGVDIRTIRVSIPASAQVVRKAQTITSETLAAVALAEAAKLVPGVALTPGGSVASVVAPLGEATVEADPAQRSGSSISVLVWVKVGGSKVASRWVSLAPQSGTSGVKPGDAVRIRLISRGATIEVAGKAKTKAWVGEAVSVTAETGTTHQGLLKENGVVEVKLG